MLTKQLLLAVLQGFPFTHLRLNRPLLFFCQVVQSAIERGASPQQALALGLSQLAPHERERLLRSLSESAAAQAEPNLPLRQQELLAALRLSGPTTCGMLSRRIGQDRSNTRKRLTQLLASNHITRVNHWGAFFYFVLPAPPTSSVMDLDQTIASFMAAAQADSYSTTNPFTGVPPTATTPSTPFTPLTSLTPPSVARSNNNNFPRTQDRPPRTLHAVRDILNANSSPNPHSSVGLREVAYQSTNRLRTSRLPDFQTSEPPPCIISLEPPRGRMALQGNLRDFTITQLLNLVNLANKSGALLVQGPNEGVQLVFREGKLAYAHLASDADGAQGGLPEVLHRAEKINDAQLNTLRRRAAGMSDKELGLLLINAGYVTQPDILEGLQAYYVSLIQQLFTWVEGRFKFDPAQDVPENKIPVRITLENLIIEGSRQMSEWEQLNSEIPNLDMALAFTDRPGVNLKKVNLNVEEWRVVSYINPKNSIRQIAKASKMNDLEIRRIVFSLLQAGLVKVIRPEGAPTQLDGLQSAFPGVERHEQKNLIGRLMKRIRSI